MTTTQTLSTYEQQAINFLNSTGAKIEISFLKTGKHFDDDKEERDIYNCTISRGNRSFTFRFGNSVVNSRYKIATRSFSRNDLKGCLDKNGHVRHYEFASKYFQLSPRELSSITYPSAPTEYDILTCLTKNDPGTFEQFCNDFGYDTDSRKAEKIYNAVKEECLNLATLFTESEIEQLAEIQ